MADFEKDTPDWVVAYLRDAIDPDAMLCVPDAPKELDGEIPWWYEMLPRETRPFHPSWTASFDPRPQQGRSFRFSGMVDDGEAQGEMYALLGLIARFSCQGSIGSFWTEGGCFDANTAFSYKGQLFIAPVGNPPFFVGVGEPFALVAGDGLYDDKPIAQRLERHGMKPENAVSFAEEPFTNPVVPKYLLVRSIWRSCAEVIGKDDHSKLAALTSKLCLLLDDHFDPLAEDDTTGWAIVERLRPGTPGGESSKNSTRVMDKLGEFVNVVAESDALQEPFQLKAGMKVRTLKEIAMTAVGDARVPAGEGGGTTGHTAYVIVPKGAELTILEAFPLGHAICTSPGWSAWVKSWNHRDGLQADADTYRLQFLQSSAKDVDYRLVP